MIFRLSLLLIFLPGLEFFGLWWFSGGLGTVLVILAFVFGSALLGGFLARRQGLRCWMEFNRQLDRGEEPNTTLMHGFLIFLGAMLLVIPGLLTSLAGLLLMIPLFRMLVITQLRLRFLAYRVQGRHAAPTPETIDIL